MTLSRDEAEALIHAQHPDPFSVLGLHDGEIVALVPGAEEVWALGKTEVALEPVVPGIFTEKWTEETYRLRARHDQTIWDFDDPYGFAPVLGAIDEYLIGEGTHTRL
ncbi:MAG: 1,4-alpha-glucan branching enzyme, partial [Thioclava sp.]